MEYVFRGIGYAMLFAVNAALFYFLHSHFCFTVMLLMLAAPVISVLLVHILKRYVEVTVESALGKGSYGRQREEAFFQIEIKNPSFLVSLECKLSVTVGNSFMKTAGEQTISVPVHMRSGYSLTLPIVATLPGLLYVEVKEITIKDLMGFCRVKKQVGKRAELAVMPQSLQEFAYDKMALEQGMLESEESTKKGNDYSDVQEIREYIPGDKLMSIHWKLSAKRDILMVKDRVSMSDKQLVIVPELCGQNPLLLDLILGCAYSIIRQLIQDKTTVRLMYWSMNRYEYEDVRIDYQSQLDDAFAKLYYESCYDSMDEAASHMALVHPEMRAYLHVWADASGAKIVVEENA